MTETAKKTRIQEILDTATKENPKPKDWLDQMADDAIDDLIKGKVSRLDWEDM